MKHCFQLLLAAFILLASCSPKIQNSGSTGEYYQLTVYRFSSAAQEKMLDEYVKDFLMPALHKNGIGTVGVFKAIANDTAAIKLLYVLMPVKSLNMIGEINQKLLVDKSLAGSEYVNTLHDAPAYNRMEVIILKQFHLAGQLTAPALKSPKSERVYELRSYESASEKIFRNKLHMFNEGDEIGIFKKLNFNAVFYGEVIAGGRMPNLMYMTSFENREDRNAHWKAFSTDPDWKKLSGIQEYKNNVSKIDITFLRPAEYSDL